MKSERTFRVLAVRVDYLQFGIRFFQIIGVAFATALLCTTANAQCAATISTAVATCLATQDVTVTSTGSIAGAGTDTGLAVDAASAISITNNGSISSVAGSALVNGSGTNSLINTLSNSGTISGAIGIYNSGMGIAQTSITTLTNTGTITGTGSYGISNATTGTIGTLNNATGTISGTLAGIYSNGTITTLNNGQGQQGALIYANKLPTNYNIIVNSTSNYGKLTAAVSGVTGSTAFGVSSSSILTANTYTNALSGLTSSNISNLSGSSVSGTLGSYAWTLSNVSGTRWDLIVSANSSGGGNSANSSGEGNSGNSGSAVSSVVTPVTVQKGQTISDSSMGSSLILNGGTLSINTSSVDAPISLPPLGGAISTNTTTSIRSNISGAGGLLIGNTANLNAPNVVVTLNKNGAYSGNAPIINLAGFNTFTGGLYIGPGVIVTFNSFTALGYGPITVSPGAVLMGVGNMYGYLEVGGIFKPGNSPGYLSGQSSVTMKSGSFYRQDIAGTAQSSASTPVGASGYYSFLNVGTQFSINSGSSLVPVLQNLFQTNESGYGSEPYVPKLGDQFRMLTAAGGITGRFTSLIQPDGLAPGTQFASFYNMNNSNSIDLAVIPSSYPTTIASVSGNKNAQSVGAALDKIAQANVTGSSTNNQDALLYAISGQNSAAGIASYAQSLAGEMYAATVAVIAQTTQRVQQAVLARLGDTMGIALPSAMTAAGNTALMNSTNTALSGGVASSAVSTNPSVNPETEYKSLSNGNIWGDLAYQKGNRSSDSNAGGWNTNLYQLVFGSDFYVSNGLRLGGGIALSNTTLNPTYGSGTIQQGSVFAYGKMPIEEYVVDVMASFGLNNSDLSRSDITNLSGGFRNKSISGNDAMVSLGVSRPIDTESVRITPYARVTWQMVNQSGVSEGDTASALSVNSYTGNGVRGVLGVALGSKTNNPVMEQYTYRVYVGVGADTSGLLNPMLNASLAGMGTSITTPNAGSTFVQAGLYGTAKVSDNAYAYAGLSGEARSGQTLGAVNIGLRIQF